MANVLHRVTLQYLMSVNTPEYSPSEWVINPDLSGVSGVEPRFWKLVGDSVVPMDDEEREVILADDFLQAKKQMIQSLDSFFGSRIALVPALEVPDGSGKFLSLSVVAQVKWAGWNAMADQLTYPLRVRTWDDADHVDVEDADALRAVYGRMVRFIAGVLDEAARAKAAVLAASSLREAKDAARPYVSF